MLNKKNILQYSGRAIYVSSSFVLFTFNSQTFLWRKLYPI